jgi:hypothetical protein
MQTYNVLENFDPHAINYSHNYKNYSYRELIDFLQETKESKVHPLSDSEERKRDAVFFLLLKHSSDPIDVIRPESTKMNEGLIGEIIKVCPRVMGRTLSSFIDICSILGYFHEEKRLRKMKPYKMTSQEWDSNILVKKARDAA